MSAVTAAAWAAGAVGVSPLLGSKATTAEAKECAPFVKNPSKRATQLQNIRDTAATNAANFETTVIPHPTNGDEELYASQGFAGNFSKTLHHDSTTGLVVPSDYQALLNACAAGTKDAWDNVPAGATAHAKLAGPLSPLQFQMEGEDSPAGVMPAPPAIASAQAAAEGVEIYWEAFCRDVPFINFASNPLITEAVTDISKLSGYQGPTPVNAQNIFRYPFTDVTFGPYISQILYQGGPNTPQQFFDGVQFVPAIRTRQPVSDPNTGNVIGPGLDFMTNFTEYLSVENSGQSAFQRTFDTQPRFIRSMRDLGALADQDTIFSIYFRAAIILGALGVGTFVNNPYNTDPRISGFNTFSGAYLDQLIGEVAKSEAAAFYHKWYVHRKLRPEAWGNLVDGILTKRLSISPSLHSDMLNSAVLPKIFTYNQQLNQLRGFPNQGSFVLPQMDPAGSPSHPSAPAGHSFTAGVGVTLLKALLNVGTPSSPVLWSSLAAPVIAAADGSLTSYTGTDASQMTLLGELNKLACNISEGRNMLGIHWKVSDNQKGGLIMGEQLVIQFLQEATATYPETFAGWVLTKFDGTTITFGGTSTVGQPCGQDCQLLVVA
ncbi:MAG TPA: hypothetical protein VF860_06225 [Candidatus Acidoferrales bacterium]